MNPPAADASSSLSPAALDAIARLERLDAVGRVIAPVVAPEVARAFEQTLVALSRALVSVRSHGRTLAVGIGSPEAAAAESAALEREVQRVESALDAHAVALRGAIDGIPLPVLRKALVAAEGGRPGDLLALLDLVLEEPASLPARCDLLDYLTTLLSTESKAGRHRVARDPVTLTPALAATCERLAVASGADLAALEREFVDAAHRCESGDIGTVIPEMRARKTAVGAAIFAPGVLRAVVYYNATVATALRSRIDAERAAGTAPPSAAVRRDVPPATRAAAPESGAGVLPRAEAFPAARAAAVHVPPPPAAAALPAAADEAAAPPAVAAASPAVTPEASVHWKLDAPQPPPATARAESAPRRPRRWMAAGAGGAALAAACAAFLLSGSPPDRAQPLSATELQHLPTFVKGGYRDHARTGSLFIGTVGPEWAELPPAERRQNADRLVAELSHSGIREVLLYDSAQRLVVHHADGLPLRLL